MAKKNTPSSPISFSASVDLETGSPTSYEAAFLELEDLLHQIEIGQLPLDQLLSGYQRGTALLKFCQQQLQAVDDQIKLQTETELKPWLPE